jgi:microcystin-dependent protein
MADVFTSFLQLLKQETGNNNNNWGVLLNTQVIDRVEQAIAGVTNVAVTGGTKTLTDDEARSAILVIAGVLTSASIIDVPAGRSRQWKIHNNTTGNFPVSMRVAGQVSTFTLSRSCTQDVWSDGGSFYETAPGQIPVGGTMHFMGGAVPANFAEMAGGTLNRVLYSRLFAAIGTTWGAGDGSTTFHLPNAQDRYLRGRSGTFGIGYLGQDVQSHNHGASSDAQGFHGHTGTALSAGNHNHDISRTTSLVPGSGAQGGAQVSANNVSGSTTTDGAHAHTLSINGDGSHAHNITVGYTGGSETRPNSLQGIACIRII